MKQDKKDTMLISMILSRNNVDNHAITWEDARYLHCPNVNECKIKMYAFAIECLCNGMSYQELYELIDKMSLEEYEKLDENAKKYVKRRICNDLKTRENNEIKKESIINE